jgi:hypothetical protein
MQLALHPRQISQLMLKRIDLTKMTKRHQEQIRAVMASPKLDENQKYRASKRILATHDFYAAMRDAYHCQLKAYDAQDRAAESGPEAKDEFNRGVRRSMFQGCLPLVRNVSTRYWQVSKLYIFAPWVEAKMIERVKQIPGLCLFNGILLPVLLLSLRLEILQAEIVEKLAKELAKQKP